MSRSKGIITLSLPEVLRLGFSFLLYSKDIGNREKDQEWCLQLSLEDLHNFIHYVELVPLFGIHNQISKIIVIDIHSV